MKLDCPTYSKQKNLKGVYSGDWMWSLKSLAKFKCESKTSLHAVQDKRQLCSVLMFFSYYFKNG